VQVLFFAGQEHNQLLAVWFSLLATCDSRGRHVPESAAMNYVARCLGILHIKNDKLAYWQQLRMGKCIPRYRMFAACSRLLLFQWLIFLCLETCNSDMPELEYRKRTLLTKGIKVI
jgi:hypothetical protein